jgi:hypothetical protein
MSEERDDVMAVELLLLEPEIVAWLDDYRLPPDEADDEDPPPQAA